MTGRPDRRAARRIAAIVAGEAGKTTLRVSVEGGGCSGFSYKFDLVGDRNADDLAIEQDGATVLIDECRSITWAARRSTSSTT